MIATQNHNLVDIAETYRIEANQRLNRKRQVELGQFMTPSAIADFMASLFKGKKEKVTLLDAGAGVGSLTASFI